MNISYTYNFHKMVCTKTIFQVRKILFFIIKDLSKKLTHATTVTSYEVIIELKVFVM